MWNEEKKKEWCDQAKGAVFYTPTSDTPTQYKAVDSREGVQILVKRTCVANSKSAGSCDNSKRKLPSHRVGLLESSGGLVKSMAEARRKNYHDQKIQQEKGTLS